MDASPNRHMGNLHVARARATIHGHHQEGVPLVSPGAIVEDETPVPLPLELQEKTVVLERFVVETPPETPLALELAEESLIAGAGARSRALQQSTLSSWRHAPWSGPVPPHHPPEGQGGLGTLGQRCRLRRQASSSSPSLPDERTRHGSAPPLGSSH